MSAVPVLGSAGNPAPQNSETKASTNLIVNYLPPKMSEEEVRNLFAGVGTIQTCKLIKDKLTQDSLGYAFINYNSPHEAEKAIQSLNGLPLLNKTIKVSYARPSSVQIKNANLYIAYLPKNYTQTDLEALFRPFGTIITSKVLIDTGTGQSRGVGFVRFDKHTEAQVAISALNGKLLPGCSQPILVKFANQYKGSGSGDEQSEAHVHLGVGRGANAVASLQALGTGTNNLVGASAITTVRRQVTPYGTATAGGPIRHTMNAMRFNPVSTLAAAGTLGPHSLAAIPSLAAPGLPHNPGSQGNFCIFVYNLPESAADNLLYQLFSPFGAISSVKVIRDLKTQQCKKYGFVNMVSYEEAYQAIVSLNGYILEGKTLQGWLTD